MYNPMLAIANEVGELMEWLKEIKKGLVGV